MDQAQNGSHGGVIEGPDTKPNRVVSCRSISVPPCRSHRARLPTSSNRCCDSHSNSSTWTTRSSGAEIANPLDFRASLLEEDGEDLAGMPVGRA